MRNGLWPKNLPILTGRDSGGSIAVVPDEHPQLGITGYSVPAWQLPGTAMHRHLTKTTKRKSPPGPCWPLLCQQKGSSRRSPWLQAMSAFVSISANPAALLEAVWGELPVLSQDEMWGQEPSAEGQQKQLGSSHFLKHSRICKKEHLSVASTTCEVWMVWCRHSPAPSSTSYTTQPLPCADTVLYTIKSASEPNSNQNWNAEKACVFSWEGSSNVKKMEKKKNILIAPFEGKTRSDTQIIQFFSNF